MKEIWKYTTFKTENFAKHFLEVKNINDLIVLKEKINLIKNYIVIWWWSNILLTKKRYDDVLFVKNSLTWSKYLWKNQYLVYSWEIFSKFIINLIEKYGLNTLTPMFWIPWTIGGAVIGNAGSFGLDIWRFVKKVRYIDEKWSTIENDKYQFKYRWSNFKWRSIFLINIIFDIPNDFIKDQKKFNYYKNWREEKQECNKTCWSFFKNIKFKKTDLNYSKLIEKLLWYEDSPLKRDFNLNSDIIAIPVWWLVEKCWLKWLDRGWVKVSSKHWNFILNYNNIDSENIIALSKTIKEEVFMKFGLILEEEVRII
jgi:UDP-N-acetylmuramate dehydrogenase